MFEWLWPEYNYAAKCKAENEKADFKGKQVLVVGGTSGIGAAVAERYAQLGANVWISGRSETRGASIVDRLQSAHGISAKFYKVDMSRVRDTDAFTKAVIKDLGKGKKIDHLVDTAGGPPAFSYMETDDGLERTFAVQCLGRYLVTSRLAPYVSSSIVHICARPGSSNSMDATDPGFRTNKESYTLMARATSLGLYVDTMVYEFSLRYPKVLFGHLYPGIVSSTDAVNNGPFPTYFKWIANAGIYLLGTPAATYADIPIAEGLNHGSSDLSNNLILRFNTGSEATLTDWPKNAENRAALWNSTMAVLKEFNVEQNK